MAVATRDFMHHINDFFNYRKTIYEISDQTVKSNRVDLSLFENFVRRKNVKTIDGPSIIGFQYYLKQERTNCGASINRKIFTLRSYANLAENLPFYDVLKIRQGYRQRPHALVPEKIKILFESIDTGTVLGIRDYAVYALMYQTGLRVGEVHTLNLNSLDLKNHKITVIGKGKKPRTLHMNKELEEILTQYLAVRPNFYRSWENDALFLSKKGNRLAIRTMEDNLKKIVRYAPLNVQFNVTCHTLRHSFASHLNDNDVDILVIQSLLGHSSPRSTETYIHPSMDKIREAIEKLPSVLYVKELIRTGVLNLNFQQPYKSKRE
ncbi:MAG: tyrosine-type recombinase/integrase [Deltaproteobacteria bacterium]|nr:tyrosine-type recombinase/integrase [Deltaproteobacteria bacterium]